MKTKIFFAVVAMFGFICAANAQNAEMPKYQRSSLHLVLLTTDEAGLNGAEDFTAQLDAAWQGYPFPDKYNRHSIALTQAHGGAPKGGFLELVNRFQGGFQGMSLADAKSLLEDLKSGKAYKEELVKAINDIIATEKVGNQLMRKWWNIQDDGSWDYNLIKERASYNANQAAVAEAQATFRGLQTIIDQGEDLISNTFVTFSKLQFYPSEPVAAFIRNLMLFISELTPAPANMVLSAAANTTYAATSKGYTAATTTALYKLEWNDEIKNAFYQMFENDKINMEKFNAYTFPMTLVGIDKATSTTIDAAGSLGALVGKEDAGKPEDVLISQTVGRNIDKLFAKLQKSYEVFAPVSQIISVDPLVADMGMKEGLEGGESFNLLEPYENKETKKIEWRSVGIVKVAKKDIWDNRYALTDEAKKAQDAATVKGTVLSNNKKAAVGMVVRQVVKANK